MADTIPFFHIRGSGSSLFIDAGDGKPLGGKHYRCYHIAVTRAHSLENEARIAPRKKVRPCLTCGATITSTGPHHRRCDPCRARS